MSQAASANPDNYPGKTLGIVGLIASFFFTILGLILSIVAFNQSKAAGYSNTPAKVGIILSIVFIVIGILFAVILLPAIFAGLCQVDPSACI